MIRWLPFALLLCLDIGIPISASAHDGHWYSWECCHDQDCAPVDKVEFLQPKQTGMLGISTPMPSVMVVTTKHGTAIVPPDLPRRASQDNRLHACIHAGHLICIYIPPGS